MDNAKQEFVHVPVLAGVVPDALVGSPDGVYVDGTFGRGGHSRLILSRLSDKGRLIAFDRDPEAVAAAKLIDDPRFTIVHAPFNSMKENLERLGIGKVDGVFLDIGVSSPQIDDPQRGFSFRFDGALDMRMDTTSGFTAAEWLNSAEEKEIARVIKEFGEEKFASKIAAAIVRQRAQKPFETTRDLADLVARTIPRNRHDATQHPATRTFQAVRIQVNGELDQLRSALNQAGEILAPGGRLAVISFHSLEDRIVKKFFEKCSNPAAGIDPRLPLMPDQLPQPLFEKPRRILPDEEEKLRNPRARSSVLRVGERTGEHWRGEL